MTDNAYQVATRSDEFDLLALFERFIIFFRRFGKTIIIFGVIGLLLGILSYVTMPKQFGSKLILHSSVLTNAEQIQIIETWQDLLRKQEYELLAAQFNIDPAILMKTNKIEAEEIQKLYIQDNPNGFTVKVLVRDTSILDELQKGIVHGLQNSDYIKDRIAVRKSNLTQLINKVQIEIATLDSTKRDVEGIISSRTKNTSTLMIDVTGIHGQLVSLNEKLLSFKESLRFVEAVQVLQNFNRFRKPEKPKLVKSIALGLLAGLFIGYFVALYQSVKQKLKLRSQLQAVPM